jgi:hypothetical protein
MPTKKDGEKPKKGAGKSGKTGVGYTTSMRKASKEERIAVRGTGARKEARKGNLVAIYSEEKGARLATSRNSGETVASVTEADRATGSNTTTGYGGTSPGKNKRESATAQANRNFYGDTKLGRRLVKKANRAGNTGGISAGFTKANVKKKYQGKTK